MNFEPRLRRSAIDIIEASFVRSSASGSPAPGPAATPSVASFVSTEEGNKKAMADEECSSPKEPLSTEDFKRLVPLIPTMVSF